MKIKVKIKHPSKMRYATLDDYRVINGKLVVDIADTKDNDFNIILLIHALGEYLLASNNNVSQDMIDAFDMANLNSPEPGLELDCPYREAHLIMEGIERILLASINVPWSMYEKRLEDVCKERKNG